MFLRRTTDGNYGSGWKIVYFLYPPLLRILERLGFHKGGQDYHIGYVKKNYSISDLKDYLEKKGFEPAVLSWNEKDEVLNLRKVNKRIYQWHIRVFKDREIKGHYEFSSEGSPIAHICKKLFITEEKYYLNLFSKFLDKGR